MAMHVCTTCNQYATERDGKMEHVTPPMYGKPHEPTVQESEKSNVLSMDQFRKKS